MTESYGMPFNFIAFLFIFIHNKALMSEVLYLHQTFADYVSYQYTHFGLSICQKIYADVWDF